MTHTDLLLGIDVGTFSTKGLLTDSQGRVHGSLTVEHGVELPQPGWAQQDADEVWWADVVTVAQELTGQARSLGADIVAVGVSAIGPCLLPLDRSGAPLRPGILYGVDTRASAQIETMNRSIGQEQIRQFSRMDLSSQAVGPKLWWLREAEPDVWEDAVAFATATSYLVLRLTGRHVMDHHTAAHWMPYYDPRSNGWSTALVDDSEVCERLPDLGWADQLAGEVTPHAAEVTGLAIGTPVVVGTVDALSESIGVGLREPGDLMAMYGTTAFFILRTRGPVVRPGMWCLPGAFASEHVLAAGMATSGAVTRWFRDEFAGDLSEAEAYDQLFDAALKVPPGARGLVALPYFSGERTPINDPDARGVIAGLSLVHKRADVFRALLEGVGYGIRHNLEAMSSDAQPIERVIAVGGGTRSDTWMQIVSDVCGRIQQVPRQTIGASYGDAYLAGLVSGLTSRHTDWAEIGSRIVPNSRNRDTYDRGFSRYLTLYAATREVVHALAHEAGECRCGTTRPT
jgi:xylulokinase